ncbi:recombinase family protein, partial [Candidatus Saccharibacteria bacterium]|nr:recombinase family protein [Candidatus Saccharibacteria bacterium]
MAKHLKNFWLNSMSDTNDKTQKTGAIIYLRVSTEEQVDNYSLDTQLDICKKEAERRGYSVLEVFREEGRSAKTIRDRPTLIELLEYCRKNRKNIGAVIVYRLDRISRQTADYLAIRKKLTEIDITLISASEPTGDTPTERFIETMLAGFAQMDNDVRGERSRNGMKARFLSGLPNGNIPLGYKSKNGYAVKDAEVFNILKSAWDQMAMGTKSLREMAEILNKQGLVASQKGRAEKLIRAQTLSCIFRNKFYAGKLTSRKYGLEVQGQHAPMITEEQFYKVQAILDGRNRNNAPELSKRNQDNPSFPLRRIIKCSRCKNSFTGAWSKGKKSRYGYYFCQKRCGTGSSVPVKVIEDTTSQLLDRISLQPETVKLINAYLKQAYFLRLGALRNKREEADTELKKIYELRQSLIEKNLNGVYSDDIFKEQNKLLEEKIGGLQAAKSDSVIDKYNLETITTFIQNKFTNLNDTFESSLLKQKRVLMCSIFPEGLNWSYPGYSNTQINPFYRCLIDVQEHKVKLGTPGGIRTPD